jgi:hypothetical protein
MFASEISENMKALKTFLKKAKFKKRNSMDWFDFARTIPTNEQCQIDV